MSNQDNTPSQIELEQHLQFQSLLAELSANFVRVPTDMIDQEMQESLRRIAENLDLDLIALGLLTADGQDFFSRYQYAKPFMKPWLASSLMAESPLLTRTLLLTSVGFFTDRFPPSRQPRISYSYRASWAMLPVGLV